MTVEKWSAGGPMQASSSASSTGNLLPALPLRAAHLQVAQLVDLYMAHYAGRDPTRLQRLSWWQAQIGHLTLEAVSDDDIHLALESLVGQHSRYFAGTDADGKITSDFADGLAGTSP